MSSQNPWDVLPKTVPDKQPYQEVAEKFPELAPQHSAQQANPWEALEPAPESTLESANRQGQQYTRRGLEAIFGLPGEFESIARSLSNSKPKQLPYHDENFKHPEPLLGKENILPTISDIRQHGIEKHGDRFEPKDYLESKVGEVIQKAVLAPGGPLTRAAVALGSNMVKDAAEALGADEKGQAIADGVASFALSRISAPTVRDYFNRQYDLAERAIPRNATMAAGTSQGFLNAIRQRLDDGGFAAWKEPVRQQIAALENNIQNGRIRVRALVQAQKDINFQRATPGLAAEAQRELTTIARGVRHQLRQYGQTNPNFTQPWRNANAAYAGWAQSRRATDFMNRNVGKLTAGGGSALLLNLLKYGPEVTAQAASAIGATYGVTTAGQFMSRVFSNRVLFNYYMRTMAGAAAENVPQMVSNYNKLDKALKKENEQSSKK